MISVEPKVSALLADDSRPLRSLIRSVFPFGNDHPEFCEVSNGEEAVAAYRQRRYDIVLLDIKMPVLDGLSALKAIRIYDEDAFVVMISGELTPENRLRATSAGAISLVAKPVNQLVARQIIQSYRRRMRRPASVLVVDASLFIIAALKQGMDILQFPYRMSRAHSLVEATIAFDEVYFDLVFIDSQLEGSGGLELLGHIKATRPLTYVVMFSDDCTKESVLKARERGADDYLLKTVDLAQLKKVWTRFLAASKDEFSSDGPPPTF